jgi:hypothetical protein
MSIAFAVFAVAGITAIARLAWGAILVSREIDHEEQACTDLTWH